jgi:hypothetical protein
MIEVKQSYLNRTRNSWVAVPMLVLDFQSSHNATRSYSSGKCDEIYEYQTNVPHSLSNHSNEIH